MGRARNYAARRWQVDVSTVIGIRRTVKEAALAALARNLGRPAKERDWALERARAEIGQFTEHDRGRGVSRSRKPGGGLVAEGGHVARAVEGLDDEAVRPVDRAVNEGAADAGHHLGLTRFGGQPDYAARARESGAPSSEHRCRSGLGPALQAVIGLAQHLQDAERDFTDERLPVLDRAQGLKEHTLQPDPNPGVEQGLMHTVAVDADPPGPTFPTPARR